MPTKRRPIARGRRTIQGSPDELWRAGDYIRAWALNPLIEFTHHDHLMTHAEIVEADALRQKLGLDDAD